MCVCVCVLAESISASGIRVSMWISIQLAHYARLEHRHHLAKVRTQYSGMLFAKLATTVEEADEEELEEDGSQRGSTPWNAVDVTHSKCEATQGICLIKHSYLTC